LSVLKCSAVMVNPLCDLSTMALDDFRYFLGMGTSIVANKLFISPAHFTFNLNGFPLKDPSSLRFKPPMRCSPTRITHFFTFSTPSTSIVNSLFVSSSCLTAVSGANQNSRFTSPAIATGSFSSREITVVSSTSTHVGKRDIDFVVMMKGRHV